MSGLEKDLRDSLHEGLRALGLALGDQQVSQLLDYQALIAKWTRVYNLTAVRDPAEMMTHHLLDSLAAVAPLRRYLQQAGLEQGIRLLDVGSGAGLPGVLSSARVLDTVVPHANTYKKSQNVSATLNPAPI